MTQVWSIVVAGGVRPALRRGEAVLPPRWAPLLSWAVDACRRVSDGVVLVLPADASSRRPPTSTRSSRAGRPGADSVRCGLAAVPAEAEIVMVHDAARPLAPAALFAAVLAAALDEDGVDGAVPGLAPSDTIKVVDESDAP